MKRVVIILSATLFAFACSSVQHIGDADRLKVAAWKAIGIEQVAWSNHDSGAIPRGMDSVVSLKQMKAHVENVALAGSDGTVTTTYWYSGTFNTAEGQRDGTLTVQRKLHFKRDDAGDWTQSAPAEEVARSLQLYNARSAAS